MRADQEKSNQNTCRGDGIADWVELLFDSDPFDVASLPGPSEAPTLSLVPTLSISGLLVLGGLLLLGAYAARRRSGARRASQ